MNLSMSTLVIQSLMTKVHDKRDCAMDSKTILKCVDDRKVRSNICSNISY